MTRSFITHFNKDLVYSLLYSKKLERIKVNGTLRYMVDQLHN